MASKLAIYACVLVILVVGTIADDTEEDPETRFNRMFNVGKVAQDTGRCITEFRRKIPGLLKRSDVWECLNDCTFEGGSCPCTCHGELECNEPVEAIAEEDPYARLETVEEEEAERGQCLEESKFPGDTEWKCVQRECINADRSCPCRCRGEMKCIHPFMDEAW